jgi:hypothetical protein
MDSALGWSLTTTVSHVVGSKVNGYQEHVFLWHGRQERIAKERFCAHNDERRQGEAMIKIRLDELGQTLRQKLASIGDEESMVIEDENGQARYGVIPYRRPTAEQKRCAWERLRQLQDKVAASMKEQGVTEDDLMQELLKDD